MIHSARRSDVPSDETVPHVEGFDDLALVGRGGFSAVYGARQRGFNRRVALKVLSFGLADERERRSFERECRAMGLVSQHPNIVTVFNAAFTRAKQPVIVMELYAHGSLGDRLKREGPLPVATVLDVGVKIAGALQTAHDRGLLHHDIKPQNLFVSEFGEPALGDFGISTLDDERSISGGGGLTVHYAPPEVLEGVDPTTSSDVYSLAATLYALLDGSRPFSSPAGGRQRVAELARRIMLEEPPRVTRPDVPASLRDVLARAMSKQPAQRPPSAAALGRELQRIQGQLGLPVTALPVAGAPAPPAPPTPPAVPPAVRSVVGAAPPAGRPVMAPPSPPAGAESDGSVTVARARPGHDADRDGATPAAAPPEPPLRRIVVGTVAGVTCLLAVAGGIFWLGRGDDEPADTTTPASATIQVVDVDPPTPQGVTVTVGAAPGTVTVAWQPVGIPGVHYQVRPQTGGAAQNTTETSATFTDVPEGTRPCYTVVAITDDGRDSDESTLACL